MDKIDAKRIFLEIRANSAALRACEKPHAFEPHERYSSSSVSPVRTYRCTKCSGIVGMSEATWYIQGLADFVPTKSVAHNVVTVGPLGEKIGYLNVSREQAIARYLKARGAFDPRIDIVEEFSITDEFDTPDMQPR